MPHPLSPTRSGLALVAVGDPTRDRTVYATIVLLVALGLAMIMLALWLVRSTRPDPEVLAPLERMGERKWRRADPVWQRRRLDEVRPTDADPLEPTSAPPATDAEFERGPQPIGFDDLVAASPATVAVPSTLPAPPAEARPVAGPIDMSANAVVGYDAAGADQAPAAAGDATAADASAADVSVEAEAETASADAGDDDDDEDITGEQDTDDFFAFTADDNDADDFAFTADDNDADADDVDPGIPIDVEPGLDEDDRPG